MSIESVESPAPTAAASLHMDQYGSGRLPYFCQGAVGVVQEMVREDRSRTFSVIDASGGYASACIGAAHPFLTAAAVGLATVGYATDEVGHLARSRMLNDLFGPKGAWTDHFPFGQYHVAGRNSGSEGVELAIRLAVEARFDYRRQRTRERYQERDTIVAFEGAWHGWTAGLVPLLDRRHYRVGLGEPDLTVFGLRVKHLPFGHSEALEQFFLEQGHRVLAVIVEPIQGDAGILLPPNGYLRRLRQLSDLHDALLIADEVLTFAKTGRYFAMVDADGPILTDITVIGKSLGMGYFSTSMVIARRFLQVRPTGAVCTSDLRPPVCELIRLGTQFLETAGLVSGAAERGESLRTRLQQRLLQRFPKVFTSVRGLGFLNGIELTEAAAGVSRALRIHLLEAGAYVELMAGAGRRSGGSRFVFPTLRVAPPLIISDSEIEELIDRLERGVQTFIETEQC